MTVFATVRLEFVLCCCAQPKKPSLDIQPPAAKRRRRFEDVPSLPDGVVRERRVDKTEKSDAEQAVKVLDGEPEVTCACFFNVVMTNR